MTRTTTRRTSYSTPYAADFIARREAFTTSGAMRADHVRWAVGMGRLPGEHRTALEVALDQARSRGESLYVVWSYGTPIAWALPGEALTVPDVRYSLTTGRHQSAVRHSEIPALLTA